MKVVAAVQARMDSKRLPGKVLADVCGEPMIARIHERVSYAETVDQVVIATTTDPTDDELVAECERRGFDYVRGPVDKLAVRLFLAGGTFGADAVVRVWGDCPCVDPALVDEAVAALWRGVLVVIDDGPRYGLGVEVFRMAALKAVPGDDDFAQLYPAHGAERMAFIGRAPAIKETPLAVDYPEDLERTRRIYGALYSPDKPFGWQEVLALPDEILSIGQDHPRNVEYREAMAT